MSYFKEFPNLEYVNRFPNAKSNDEVTIAKNIFKRAKIREDLASVFSVFEYYTIGDNERPEQIAEKIYGNPEYDWIIIIANNIIDVYEQWPLSQAQLNEYLLKKYGSEQALEEIHHYETLELKDSYNRVVLPQGLIVDKAFYDAPEYQTITETPPGITFPPIYLDGIVAITTAQLGTTIDTQRKVVSVLVGDSRGYKTTPTVIFSPPTTTSDASVVFGINNYQVSSIVGLNTGKGYDTAPNIVIDSPPTSVQASAQAVLGVDLESDSVVSTIITNPGIGYGLTSPSVTFSLPPTLINGGIYRNQSSISVGSQVDGMYVRSDGSKVFVTSGIGTYLVKSYNLTEPWSVITATPLNQLNVSSRFSYCTGIELSPDGTKLFLSGGLSGNFLIARYDLGTPWELNSATFISQMTVTAPGGVRLKPDGTRLYILNSNNPDSIEEYQLTVAWDITTRVFLGSYNISNPTGDNGILGFSFNSNGTKMFVAGFDSSSLYEFDLNPWDLSSLSYAANLYVGDRISNPSDIFLSNDADNIIISGGVNDKLIQYQNFVRTKGSAVVENSSLKRIDITSVGIGYTVPPSITIDPPYPSVSAAATAILSPTGGYIQNVVITNPGFGYTVAPTAKIDKAPVYSTAVGIASVVNEKVVSVTILDGGNNYKTPPTITLTPGPELTLNVFEGDTYSQANKTWRWNGSAWQERITEPYQFLDGNVIKSASGNAIAIPISVYEYEKRINEDKRLIIIPKQQYISTIIRDLKDIMKYDLDSDDVINSGLKATYNPKLTGV
jgi:Base plate wedge protein 53